MATTIRLPATPAGLPPIPFGAEATHPRREELLDLFARHVYGVTPSASIDLSARERSRVRLASGSAERREVTLSLSRGARNVDLELLVYLPTHAPTPRSGRPVFVGLNFGGNQSVDPDPAIRISTSHTIDRPGTEANRATDASRGIAAGRWPVETIVARGYALVTLHCGDVRPDLADGRASGVQELFDDLADVPPDERWGAIGAWAWGLSRVLDYLADVPDVDATRAVVIGHSRLGKAALWAGAQDERFAGVVSNDSGCGGAAIYRRLLGERVSDITGKFPHWFCRAHDRYRDAEHELPVDQHMLLALVAPRMLHVGSATEDLWADPDGELLACILASDAYRALGASGLPEAWSDAVASGEGAPTDAPADALAPVAPVGGTLRYHRRSGPHNVTAEDWHAYLDHADACIAGGAS